MCVYYRQGGDEKCDFLFCLIVKFYMLNVPLNLIVLFQFFSFFFVYQFWEIGGHPT